VDIDDVVDKEVDVLLSIIFSVIKVTDGQFFRVGKEYLMIW